MPVTGPEDSGPSLAIFLFGSFEARVHGAPLPRLRSRKGQWLLALLTLRAGATLERAWLAGTLWPDSPETQALASLRMALTDLRGALGPEAGRLSSPTPQTLRLDLEGAEADVLAFDRAMARGDPAGLEEAVGLYRGPLLDRCTEEWVFQERQPREQAYLGALEALAALAMARGDPVAAERQLRRAVTVDPLRESTQRALMQALAAAGNYAAALHTYRELRLRLHRELHAEPDPETMALFGQIREDARRRAAGASPTRSSTLSVPTTVAPSRDLTPDDLTDEIGNPALPEKLRASVAVSRRPEPEPCPRESQGEQVALLFKRHAQPDEHLLQLLETQLKSHGFRVFIDRHPEIGVEWAREIERQIRGSDAVVPLLSVASVSSEMLQYEVQIAHEAAQQQGGKPRLLPIRIRDTGPLPEGLAALLDPLEYALWQGPHDDEWLISELLRALETPVQAVLGARCSVLGGTKTGPSPAKHQAPSTKHRSVATLEPVGGAVPLDSPFYVVRPVDAEFRAAIARKDSIVLVKGARQMGKTSLLARGLQQAREAGDRVVVTDLQRLNAADRESAETLYVTLAGWIADQLELDVFLDQIWSPRLGPSGNFERYLRRQVLGKTDPPLVWGLDEVDALAACSFGSEVFGLFRSLHGARSLDPEGPWDRLTLAMAYATEPHLFIQDIHHSPFNVGTRVTLDDFSLAEVTELNRRYDRPLRDDAEVARYADLLGGHPYLVHRGLQEMAKQGIDIAGFEAQADRDDGVFGDHLKRLLVLLVGAPELREEVQEVLRDRPCQSASHFFRLRSAGVLAGGSARDARLRCPLYATYLERHLL